MAGRPNVLLILTDQQHHPPPYESEELAAFRREHLAGVERLRQNGVSFPHHYPMSAACAPSRTSLLTGHYPSLHGVTQTDGIGKSADGEDMFWLAPDGLRRWATGSAPAAIGRITRASGMPRTRISTPTM